MQIARLSSAGWVPEARAEILVTPINPRGEVDKLNAMRV